MDGCLPSPSIHGIFQATVLEWVAISFSRGSSRPRDGTQVSHIVGRRFTVWASIIFSIVVVPTYVLTNRVQEFPFLCILANIYHLCFFDDILPDRCEMTPHCGFDLCFSNNEWCWTSFHEVSRGMDWTVCFLRNTGGAEPFGKCFGRCSDASFTLGCRGGGRRRCWRWSREQPPADPPTATSVSHPQCYRGLAGSITQTVLTLRPCTQVFPHQLAHWVDTHTHTPLVITTASYTGVSALPDSQ